MINQTNVVVLTPCGSGKSVIFELGVIILRKVKKIEHGIGICLEPLNNILSEKTNKRDMLKSAYLTMTGESVKQGNAVLSSPVEKIISGEITYLYGHPESFLSIKGKYACYYVIYITIIFLLPMAPRGILSKYYH